MDGPALLQKLRDSSRIPPPPNLPHPQARSPADLCHQASFVRHLLCPAIGNRVQLPLSANETADICSPRAARSPRIPIPSFSLSLSFSVGHALYVYIYVHSSVPRPHRPFCSRRNRFGKWMHTFDSHARDIIKTIYHFEFLACKVNFLSGERKG